MKIFISILFMVTLFVSCNSSTDSFIIEKQQVGLLTNSSIVEDLDVIFNEDSISNLTSDKLYSKGFNAIQIFDKQGKKLLALTPHTLTNDSSKISTVQIFDPRYKTKKGITVESTFKDIKTHYKLSKIHNLLGSVVIDVEELNATFTIDKNELPENIRHNSTLNIEDIHIPDNAKIKYLMIHWN